MARLSKEEHEEIIRQLSEKSNADPEMMDFFDKLRADFEESIAVDWEEVKKEWEGKATEAESRAEQYRQERDTAIGERDEARRQYRERFFNVREEAEQIVAREKKDSPRGLASVLNIKEV